MIELRFHHELYDGSAIDEAVGVYQPYATLTIARDPSGTLVKIDAKPADQGGADPALVAAELMNYALGKTVERSRAASGAAEGGAAA